MEDTQHTARAIESEVSEQSEERRTEETPGVIVARMLANPRRVRRN